MSPYDSDVRTSFRSRKKVGDTTGIGIVSVKLFWTSAVKVGIFTVHSLRKMLNPDRIRLERLIAQKNNERIMVPF